MNGISENMFSKINKKQIKILIIVFVIVLFVVVALFIIKQKTLNVVLPVLQKEESLEEQKIVTPQIENKVMPITITEESTVESLSSNFAERLGSYSTDNRQENFISLNSYLTKEARSVLDTYISNNEKLNGNDYYGISSKALNARAVISGESASSVVRLQQVETSGSDLKSNVIYKNLNLELIKQDGAWLVTSFKWE